jgi:alkanesulfonate monooxygenase SsuD/methylene tetrahydromethanopterin reductase-like flavin-dependent oxidoreductase (luciferase family)
MSLYLKHCYYKSSFIFNLKVKIMRFSYHPSMCNPSFYIELGKAAESAGFDAITFPDSICYPKECDSTYPYNDDGSRDFLDGVPFLEPFSIIPAIAAVTDKLEFSTSVYKLAPRQAVTTAKFVTTLGVMTNNRFHFGVGVSPWYEDFLATGERWEKRGKRMDEQIEILKGLMNGEYFSYKGEFYDIPELKLCPVPTKPVPILIGGHSKPALRRAARCDGWISAGLNLDETKNLIDQINVFRKEYGTLNHPQYQFQVMGEAAYSPEGINQLEGLGATEVIVAFRNTYEGGADERTLESMIKEINWYAEEVIHKSK